MKNVVILGTIHLNWTPKEELVEEIAKYSPDKIFIELTKKEVEEGKDNSIRDEMFNVLEYAKLNGVNYFLFDTDRDTFKAGVTGKEPGFNEYENKVKKLLSNYNWKDLNKQEPWLEPKVNALEEYLKNTYFDIEEMNKREEELVANITSNLVEGVNVVVTGAGHINTYLEKIPNSIAPLRKK